MEVRVDELRDILKLISSVVPKNPTLPIIKNVLLKDGQVTGTDLETMVRFELEGVDEVCLLPQKNVLELLNYVPGNLMLVIEQTGKKVKLNWGEGDAEYAVVDPKDYPGERDISIESEGTITDGDSLIKTLREMLAYHATEKERPVLNGITVGFGDSLEIVAGDGFRMAYQILPLAYPSESRVTMPAGSVSLLCTLWNKVPPPVTQADSIVKTIMSKRPLEISLSKERLIAHFGKITILSNLIEGTAPNFAQLIPKDPPHKVTFMAADLERAVRRVKSIAQSGKDIIRLTWVENQMSIVAKGEDNSASAKIGAACNDTGGRIAVNSGYLLDYLTKKEGVVTLSTTDESSPLLFHYRKEPLVVIMPMYADWGDAKPTTDETEPVVDETEPVVDEAEEPVDVIEAPEEQEESEEPEETEEYPEPKENPENTIEEKPKKGRRRKKEKVG